MDFCLDRQNTGGEADHVTAATAAFTPAVTPAFAATLTQNIGRFFGVSRQVDHRTGQLPSCVIQDVSAP